MGDLLVGDRVRRIGKDGPHGVVSDTHYGRAKPAATVNWGTLDSRPHETDEVPSALALVTEHIATPIEIQVRQAKASGMPFHFPDEHANG